MSLKPRLVDGWGELWKWGSARLMFACALAPVIYEYVQADPYLKELVSDSTFRRVMSVLAVLALLSKVVRFDAKST